VRMDRVYGRLLLLAGAVIVIGSLLPWHTVEGLGPSLNIDGIDSPNNGVVTLLGGLVIAGLGWRMVDAGNRPRRAVLAASIATAVATVWALIDASSADDSFRADVSLDRAYGQWVLLAGAVLAVLVSLALVARARGGDDAGGEGRPG